MRTLESLTLPETEADPRGMAGNAARCALELALLDAYGRLFGEPLGRAVELASVPGLRRLPVPGKVRYGAAITAESWRKELRSAIKYRLYGFHDVKTKVGVEGQDDVRRLKWFRRILGPWVDLRLDANEAWPAAAAAGPGRAAAAVLALGARATRPACRGHGPGRLCAADSACR